MEHFCLKEVWKLFKIAMYFVLGATKRSMSTRVFSVLARWDLDCPHSDKLILHSPLTILYTWCAPCGNQNKTHLWRATLKEHLEESTTGPVKPIITHFMVLGVLSLCWHVWVGTFEKVRMGSMSLIMRYACLNVTALFGCVRRPSCLPMTWALRHSWARESTTLANSYVIGCR